MRRVAILMLIFLFLLLAWNSALARTLSLSTSSSPVPTPTSSISPAPTPTQERLALPGSVGDWVKTAQGLISRYGPWAAIGIICLLIPVYFLWKVGEEVAEEEAKGIASRLRKGARVICCRLTHRLTKEEEAIIRNWHQDKKPGD